MSYLGGGCMLRKLLILGILLGISACSTNEQTTRTAPVVTAKFPASADEVSISAMSLIGTPYIWGGNTPESGFDCSGLIVYVYNNSGIRLPRTTKAMSSMATQTVKRNSLKTGDLVFFATNGGYSVSHAGIYVGDGRFVHAPSSGGVVRLNNLNESYWNKTFVLGKRVIQK